MQRGASPFNIVSVALGLAFLYLPIAILVIYSFNASRLVTVWGGWSTRWYRELLHDDARAAGRLDQPARCVIVGDAPPQCSARWPPSRWCALGRFRGRLLFSGMVYAPLVMPEVITGLVAAAAVRRARRGPRVLDDRSSPTPR